MNLEDAKNDPQSFSIELPSKLISIELSKFLSLELPKRELILSPWLPKSGLCMIHAYRGIGKTHISLGVAHAVARGGEFLGWKAAMPKNVLFIDGEMPATTLQERLAQIIKMSGDSVIAGKLTIVTPDLQTQGIMPDVVTPEGQRLLNKIITDDTDLIILDNISCLAPSIKENDASDWAPIQSWVLGLRAKGKSVLLIHHSGKGGSQRGTSKKEDVLDTVITLERPKDYESNQGARFIVKYEKTRGFYGDDAKPFEAHLIKHNGKTCWQINAIEDSTFNKVCILFNEGLTPKDIEIELDINKSTISRHLKRGRLEGLIGKREYL